GFSQDQIKVVVNQFSKRVNSTLASLEQIQQTLNQPVFFGLPSSPVVLQSINRARPMVANREAAGEMERLFRAFFDKSTGARRQNGENANV
ncbi:MAG: hypothetical protein NT090_27405, partial [Acidobacteria bacterium]|nr:hypothetical protein [Acidobacteriota bacterium]